MMFSRRQMMVTTIAASAALAVPGFAAPKKDEAMYGLIGQMIAAPGKRDELVAILAEGTTAMPGCLSYVIALDGANPDAIWITEVWTDKASHAASLQLPAVQAAIARGRPMIAGFGSRTETVPVAGVRR